MQAATIGTMIGYLESQPDEVPITFVLRDGDRMVPLKLVLSGYQDDPLRVQFELERDE